MVLLLALASSCTAVSAPPTVTQRPAPSREPSTLPELGWEREVVDALRRAGLEVDLIGGSKFESALGPRLPARVFIVRQGDSGADVLFLDRPLSDIQVCSAETVSGSSVTTIYAAGRDTLRAEGTQRPFYSMSDRFFIQAFSVRVDEALRNALHTVRPPCGTDPRAEEDCPRTRSADALGVTTPDGEIGIVGSTRATGEAINGAFLLVRRGARFGDHISVSFVSIGRRVAASSVHYGVDAMPHATPWGDVAFTLGVKPIAFPNSCWRILIDDADSGLVLFIGQ
jgi:hypothetical protein